MLTSMKQYNELVEEYKIKVLSYARIVILLVSPPSHILRNLGNFFSISFFFKPIISSTHFHHPFSLVVCSTSGSFSLHWQNVLKIVIFASRK